MATFLETKLSKLNIDHIEFDYYGQVGSDPPWVCTIRTHPPMPRTFEGEGKSYEAAFVACVRAIKSTI